MKRTNLLIASSLILICPIKIEAADFNNIMKPDIDIKATLRNGYYSCGDGRRWRAPHLTHDMFLHNFGMDPQVRFSQHTLLKRKNNKTPANDVGKLFFMIVNKLKSEHLDQKKIPNYYYSGILKNSEFPGEKLRYKGVYLWNILFRNMKSGVPSHGEIQLKLGEHNSQEMTDSAGVKWNIDTVGLSNRAYGVYCTSDINKDYMFFKTVMPISIKEKKGGPPLPHGRITAQFFLISDYLIEPKAVHDFGQPSF